MWASGLVTRPDRPRGEKKRCLCPARLWWRSAEAVRERELLHRSWCWTASCTAYQGCSPVKRGGIEIEGRSREVKKPDSIRAQMPGSSRRRDAAVRPPRDRLGARVLLGNISKTRVEARAHRWTAILSDAIGPFPRNWEMRRGEINRWSSPRTTRMLCWRWTPKDKMSVRRPTRWLFFRRSCGPPRCGDAGAQRGGLPAKAQGQTRHGPPQTTSGCRRTIRLHFNQRRRELAKMAPTRTMIKYSGGRAGPTSWDSRRGAAGLARSGVLRRFGLRACVRIGIVKTRRIHGQTSFAGHQSLRLGLRRGVVPRGGPRELQSAADRCGWPGTPPPRQATPDRFRATAACRSSALRRYGPGRRQKKAVPGAGAHLNKEKPKQ